MHRILRSIIWAWSQGKGFWRVFENLGFSWFWGVKNGKKHENPEWIWSDLGLRSSRPSQNDLLKNPENFQGFSAQKTQFLRVLSKKFGFAGVENSLSIAEIQWISQTNGWAPYLKMIPNHLKLIPRWPLDDPNKSLKALEKLLDTNRKMIPNRVRFWFGFS